MYMWSTMLLFAATRDALKKKIKIFYEKRISSGERTADLVALNVVPLKTHPLCSVDFIGHAVSPPPRLRCRPLQNIIFNRFLTVMTMMTWYNIHYWFIEINVFEEHKTHWKYWLQFGILDIIEYNCIRRTNNPCFANSADSANSEFIDAFINHNQDFIDVHCSRIG